MRTILIGADPELFMRSPNTGAFVSAREHNIVRVPGTKHEPFKVPFGAVQIDGTALEFNIDPARTVEEFVHNIQHVRETIAGYVPGYNVVAEPTATYEQEYFTWDVPSEAKELGCDPDFCGWSLEVNPRPDPQGKPFRTASGHIHIGWTDGADIFDKDHFEQCGRIARQMDYYLGIHSLSWDTDSTRRELYGKAAAFRPKPYGMEYRTLSNRWLTSEPLIRWVYNQAILGMRAAEEGRWAEKVWGDSAQKIIDTNMLDWRKHYQIELGTEEVPIAA